MRLTNYWAVIGQALPRLALAVCVMAGWGAAQELSDADKQAGLAHLARTRAGVVEATKDLSTAQWKYKPASGGWSLAEILEHITLTEDMLFESVSKVMSAPAGKPDRDYKSGDKAVTSVVTDRSQKFQAPPPLQPAGRSAEESLAHFLKSRERTVEFLKTTAGLRAHVTDSPLGQPLDAFQWLLFISAHSERHTKQMLEVKSDAGYPRGKN